MWTWISCYLSGRHDYGISCEPGAVFLRCVHCGHRRSHGWELRDDYRRASQPLAKNPKVIPPSNEFDSPRAAQRQ